MLPFRVLRGETVSIKRLNRSVNPPVFEEVTTAEVLIHPTDSTLTLADEGMSKKFLGVCEPDVGVKRGDRIETVNGDVFNVSSVNHHQGENVEHLELILERISDGG